MRDTRSLRRSPLSRFLVHLSLSFGLLGTLLPSCPAHAQAGLSSRRSGPPPSAPAYTAPAPTQAPAPAPEPPRPARHSAEIHYSGGLLTVNADNSSLNQILRDIAAQTGMKITGGVTEDRVFGTYGPAGPSAVLRALLDGTGSNMLLVANQGNVPTELILTPRSGGVTPPNPNARGFDDGEDNAAAQQSVPQRPAYIPAPLPNPNSRSPLRPGVGGIDVNPAATSPSSTSQQVVFPPVDATNPPATGTTTPVTPDGASGDSVRTPQQIFEQLQRIRQQQQQQPTNPQ